MKKLLLASVLLIASATIGHAQYRPYGQLNGGYGIGSNPSVHYVNPYVRSNGTYVGGHYQTNPNGTQYDNFGTRGNLNPYTGAYGTHTPHY